MTYQNILVSNNERVGLITLNRPKALNALNDDLMNELGQALLSFDADESIGCIVITGSEKAFAAGADISMMAKYGFMDVYKGDYITRNWETIRKIRKPVIAAVSGFALGGGCELAMMCDFILASDTAKFGQPEIKLGVMPGGAGTQRLTRYIGKSKAMELCLTGRLMDAEEAERAGLVSRIVPLDQLMTVPQVLKARHNDFRITIYPQMQPNYWGFKRRGESAEVSVLKLFWCTCLVSMERMLERDKVWTIIINERRRR